ncbi:hypothetical protein SJAG_03991 [Schizosaccharomyces japonicus yFS275]|uniref:Uncharacterized protein n=1 Tax=Schizosaccharomyces japonicus (strain yFS275 / FY16936) TaxID=402676 RepID=B6K5L5_SCHJY|nr:hypothetical protein SJAG_03991 [Schizosaccharomyces japonicus yFS275]EEB08819.1 hypothetical protein SJAG_03991 [Schizosaccharomyces japonicus yFS275]
MLRSKPAPLRLNGIASLTKSKFYETPSPLVHTPAPYSPLTPSELVANAVLVERQSPSSPWNRNIESHSPWLSGRCSSLNSQTRLLLPKTTKSSIRSKGNDSQDVSRQTSRTNSIQQSERNSFCSMSDMNDGIHYEAILSESTPKKLSFFDSDKQTSKGFRSTMKDVFTKVKHHFSPGSKAFVPLTDRKRERLKQNIHHMGLTDFQGWEHHLCEWI